MSRKVVFVLSLLVLSSLLYVRFNPIEVKSSNGYPVHNLDTHLNYTAIQEAIDAPETLDDHTIYVKEGTYYEHVVVNKSISLIGETKFSTVIDGNGTGKVINIVADNVNITGFTIINGWNKRIRYSGITLRQVDNCNITGNIIENNWYGLLLDFSSNNNIMKNKVTNNTHEGIVLKYDSDANSISSNNIVGNDFGIYIDLSLNNHISLNNFIGNVKHVRMRQPVYYNIWDNGYPSGGNYWSDYVGLDLDHDGIDDSDYLIDVNNTDHFPLMGMFSDFNATSEYHVQTVCNSTVSNFHFGIIAWWGGGYSPTINFNVTGEDGTSGFCRICIPTALMNETYSVSVNGTVVPYILLACSNNTHSYLYFTYNHSTQEVKIIPEFPSLIILSLFMIAALLAVIMYRKNSQVHRNLRVMTSIA